MKWTHLFFTALIIALILSAGCVSTEKTTVKVLAAGSLLAPLEDIEAEFETANPNVDVTVEGHGSIQCIRQITDLNKAFDLILVADESLIPDMMFRPSPDGVDFAEDYTAFARNEMVLAYTDDSAYADEITSENWIEILTRDDVRKGFSNPTLDAAGYRTILMIMLAENYYKDNTLFNRILGENLGISVQKDENGSVVELPVVMQPKKGSSVVIRDASLFLLSLLESGGIDYAFDYKSVAITQGLHYVTLPKEINLGYEEYADYYDDATVYLGFQRFATIGNKRTGLPIVYAGTIPYNAPEKELAGKLFDYTVSVFNENRAGYPVPL